MRQFAVPTSAHRSAFAIRSRLLAGMAAFSALWCAAPGFTQTLVLVRVSIKSAKDVPGKWLKVIEDFALTIKRHEQKREDVETPAAFNFIRNFLGKECEKIPGLDNTKPIGFRVNYRAPAEGAPIPIDGDILLVIPATDADALINKGLPMIGFAPPQKDATGLLTSSIAGTMPIFGRAANGYVYLTAADQRAVSTSALPSPSEVVGDASHDLLIQLGIGAVPQALRQQLYQAYQGQAAAGQAVMVASLQQQFKAMPALAGPVAELLREYNEQNIHQTLLEMELIEYQFDMDTAGRASISTSITPTKGTPLADSLIPARGPLPSKGALFANSPLQFYARRKTPEFKNVFTKLKEALLKTYESDKSELARKMKLSIEGVATAIFKDGVSDLSASLDENMVLVFGMKVADPAGLEKSLPDLVDAVKDAISSKKIKYPSSKMDVFSRDAGTVGTTKMFRFGIADPTSPEEVLELTCGVQQSVLYAAVGTKSAASLEKALKNVVITDSYEMFDINISLNGAAKLVGMSGYEADPIQMTYTGGEQATFRMNFSFSDLGRLIKEGFIEKAESKSKKGS